jgi:hypothetical protein
MPQYRSDLVKPEAARRLTELVRQRPGIGGLDRLIDARTGILRIGGCLRRLDTLPAGPDRDALASFLASYLHVPFVLPEPPTPAPSPGPPPATLASLPALSDLPPKPRLAQQTAMRVPNWWLMPLPYLLRAVNELLAADAKSAKLKTAPTVSMKSLKRGLGRC